jgi:hypothetical protein
MMSCPIFSSRVIDVSVFSTQLESAGAAGFCELLISRAPNVLEVLRSKRTGRIFFADKIDSSGLIILSDNSRTLTVLRR